MTVEEKTEIDAQINDGGGFGVYLKTQREAKNISLLRVAGRTNIQPDILLRIEAELLEQLPEPVYVRGFVRAYAEAIDEDPKAAVLRYERHYAAYQQALSARHLMGRRRFVQRVLLVGVLAVGLILALVYLLPEAPTGDPGGGAKTPASATSEAARDGAPPVAEGQGQAPSRATAAPVQEATTAQMLSVVGLKETTLKIIVDGKRPKVYHLKADMRLEIEAEKEFNILVGDARAVTLYLNGQPVTVHGREGQQVTLQLP